MRGRKDGPREGRGGPNAVVAGVTSVAKTLIKRKGYNPEDSNRRKVADNNSRRQKTDLDHPEPSLQCSQVYGGRRDSNKVGPAEDGIF